MGCYAVEIEELITLPTPGTTATVIVVYFKSINTCEIVFVPLKTHSDCTVFAAIYRKIGPHFVNSLHDYPAGLPPRLASNTTATGRVGISRRRPEFCYLGNT
jgi:hypothetical protein